MENSVVQDYAKVLSTCDLCRRRKSRCIKKHPNDIACTFCMSRGESCHFSFIKQRKSRQIRPASRGSSIEPVATPCALSQLPPSASSIQSSVPAVHASQPSPESSDSNAVETTEADGVTFQRTSNKYITSCGLAFFSENNLAELARRLGHDRVRILLHELGASSRANQATSISRVVKTQPFDATTVLQPLTNEMRATYIDAFFAEIYPIYPFLDKQAFQDAALGPLATEKLRNDKSWALLYCTILSLGILAREQGSFQPMQGSSWKLFSYILGSFCDVLFARKSLLIAQTLTAMAIFAMVHSSWPVEELLITEAARIALALHLNKQAPSRIDSAERQRTFWVIYCIEKEYCFQSTQSSVFNDVDISCPIPAAIDVADSDVDWLRVQVDLSKIISNASVTLFSALSRSRSAESCEREICRIRNDLEAWKASLPEHIRPDYPIRQRYLTKPSSLYATLQTQMLYYNLQIAICRLLIHVNVDRRCMAVAESKSMLMKTARRIVELMSFIPIEPSTSMNIIGLTPIVATFILFDLVIYNPDHSETPHNLIFLDIAAGYFQRLHVLTGSSNNGHLMADMTRIAREYTAAKCQGRSESVPNAQLRHGGIGAPVDATASADHGNVDLEPPNNRVSIPDLTQDALSEANYINLMDYPAVDALYGLDGFYGDEFSMVSSILGQQPLFNFAESDDMFG
ncbi:hypothetical protein PV10_01154 [Exophiala mesophila]|uniref:Zn(2)-C6 fungal-type domain-containing protein n=1 Tax=Exophiala mesophila TaxID=212818 RepID=A0A0D1ZTY9_EXOME|nr:uncharacterized protein PV10_01154 [Exophiala mesophila]KIV97399.1 hypothetical protein PV10_01154 [Exophiala mesophila]